MYVKSNPLMVLTKASAMPLDLGEKGFEKDCLIPRFLSTVCVLEAMNSLPRSDWMTRGRNDC